MDAHYKSQEPAELSHGLQKLGAFRSVPRLLTSFGIDPQQVFRKAGLDANLLESQTALARAASVNRLLNACVESTGCAHFALLVGQTNSLDVLGDIGALARSAPDVATALQSLVTQFKYHNGAALLWLTSQPDHATLHFCIYEAREESSSKIYAGVAATMRNVVAEMCGPGWSPIEVHLPFRRPHDVWPYRNCLRAPLVFDASAVELRFDRRWLEHPLDTADPETHRRIEQRYRQAGARGDADYPSIVRRVIRRRLLVDGCNANYVAKALSMHRRTLDRRLARADMTFRTVLDSVKYDVARQLLRDTALSVQQIATHLHYGSVANFSTAFRRWSGDTPRGFRRHHMPAAMREVASGT